MTGAPSTTPVLAAQVAGPPSAVDLTAEEDLLLLILVLGVLLILLLVLRVAGHGRETAAPQFAGTETAELMMATKVVARPQTAKEAVGTGPWTKVAVADLLLVSVLLGLLLKLAI